MKVLLTGDNSLLKAAIKGSEAAMNGLKKVGAAAFKAIAAGGAAAAAGAGFAAKKFVDFESAMAEVSTLLDAGSDAATLYGEDVLRLSKELGAAGGAADVASGLYQTLSAGFTDAAGSQMVLETAIKAGKAGLTDTNTAVDAITTALNSYGLGASEAERMSDIFFETVKRGKCVVGSTRVLMADGRYKRIDTLQAGGQVVAFDGRTFTPMPATWIDQGTKPTVKVRTRLGREIVTTWNHPYLAKQKERDRRSTKRPEWRLVSDLRVGDAIAVPTALPYFGSKAVEAHEVALLGLWLAEGSCGSSSPRISSTAYGDQVAAWATRFGCTTKNVEKRDGACPIWELTADARGHAGGNPIQAFLGDLGLLTVSSAEKHIPDAVFEWDRQSIKTLLHWLFNGDGWLSYSAHAKRNVPFQLGFCSKSERLVRDVSHLLLRFGVVGTVRRRANAWVWQTTRWEEIHRFVEAIGIDRPAAERFDKAVPDRIWASHGVVEYDPIIAIEPGEPEHVYDLTVQDIHNFIAEDIVAHNTTFPELAHGIGRVTAIAPTLGVSMEELGAATATLTAAGQNTDMTMTALTGIMRSFLKPSADMQAKIEGLGFSTGSAMIKALGFKGALDAVAGGVGELELGKLFQDTEALKGVLPLVGAQSEKFAENLEGMASSAGASQTAFEKMENTAAGKMQKIKNHIEAGLITVGGPVVGALTEMGGAFVGAFGDSAGGLVEALAGGIESITPMLADVAANVGGFVADVVGVLKEHTPQIMEFAGSFFEMTGEIRSAIMDLIPVILPILLELGSVFADAFKTVGEAISDLVPVVLPGLLRLADMFGELVSAVVPFVASIIEQMAPALVILFDNTGPILDALESMVTHVADLAKWMSENETVMEVVAGVLLTLAGVFVLFTALTWLQVVASAALAAVTSPFTILLLAVVAAVLLVLAAYKNWGAITDWISEKWEEFKAFTSNLWNTIKQFFVDYFPVLLLVFTGPIGWLIAWIIKNWDDIKAFTIEKWEAIKDWFVGFFTGLVAKFVGWFASIGDLAGKAWDILLNTLANIGQWFMDLAGSIGGFFVGLATTALDWGKNIVQGLWDGIKAKWAAFTGWFGDKWDGLVGGVKDLFDFGSPSKLFTKYGKWIVTGFQKGLDGLDGSLDIALPSQLNRATPFAEDLQPRGGGGGGGTVNHFHGNIIFQPSGRRPMRDEWEEFLRTIHSTGGGDRPS